MFHMPPAVGLASPEAFAPRASSRPCGMSRRDIGALQNEALLRDAGVPPACREPQRARRHPKNQCTMFDKASDSPTEKPDWRYP
jgi:hypothetical protein